jgi:hypothetical protein
VQVEDIMTGIERCWIMAAGREGVRERNERGWTDQSKVDSVGLHWETTSNIDLNIDNERQDCKDRYSVCVWGVIVGWVRMNAGD